MRKCTITILGVSILVLCAWQYRQPAPVSASQASSQDIFYAHLTGWYPTETGELQETIHACDTIARNQFSPSPYIKNIQNSNPHAIRAIIVPHAGYKYSCDIAASVYRLLTPATKRVIILAPSHFRAFSGIALPSFQVYQTPLGPVTIDYKTIVDLAHSSPLFFYDNSVYQTEHACEVQLPFVQTYMPEAHVIPLIVGQLTTEQLHTAASVLASHINENTIVVVSSDFTHYGTHFNYTPFAGSRAALQDRIKQLDSGALELIQKYDSNGFLTYIKRTRATICGMYPIALMIALTNNPSLAHLLSSLEPSLISYKTSARDTGTPDNSVSYVGMIFSTPEIKREYPPTESRPVKSRPDMASIAAPEDHLSRYEKRELLTMARRVLEQSFAQDMSQDMSDELLYPIKTNANSATRGAFVTLYTKAGPEKAQQELRGCIGRVVTNEPLYKTIATVTRDAAFNDTRFSPLTAQELPAITITISVLTPPRPIISYRDIKLGTHGIIITRGNQTALFLPTVPTEFGWDLPTTLAELSKKAGLESHAWQERDVTYQVFESIDFSE